MTDNRLDTTRTIKAPTGTEITCKSWLTEAPMRMLMNNLHPDVAEKPEELVVYGGIGRAVRNWECYDKIIEVLQRLEEDETLLVHPLASLRLAMNMACTLFRLTPEEALAGVTRNGAQALGLGDEIGMLKVGMHADMLLWDIEHPAELACQFGVNPIVQRIFAGEVSNVATR